MGRKSKEDLRKPEILKHFFKVLKEEGIEGASIAKIAKSMDTYPSLIMHYFKTKEDLVVELASYMIDSFIKPQLEQIKKIDDQEKKLHAILDTFLFMTGHTDDMRVFPSTFYLASRNVEIREKLMNKFHIIIDFISEEIKSFIESGLLKNIDPERMASIIVTIGLGIKQFEIFFDNEFTSKNNKKFIKNLILEIIQ